MTWTAKKERFCEELIKGESKADAYRKAYNTDSMKPSTVYDCAYKLSLDPEITHRIMEMRAEIRKEIGVTVETMAEEFEENRQFALSLGQLGAAATSSTAKAKLYGLQSERKEVSGPGGSPIEIDHDYKVEFVNAPS